MPSTGPKASAAAISAGAPLAETFSFRPAPLRGPRDWRLEGGLLQGPDGACDLAQVTGARFVEMVVRGIRMRRLDLSGPEGLTRIAINSAEGLPPGDPDRAAHRALCVAVCQRLAERAPDLPVTLGESGAIRRVWFGIGILSLLMGPGIGIAALSTGVSGDRLAAIVLPVAMLGLLGLYLMTSFNPWRKLPEVPVSGLPALLEAMDGAPEDAPET